MLGCLASCRGSSRAFESSRPSDQGVATRSARGQSLSGLGGCCSGVGRNSILLYSCMMPGKINFRPPPVLILVLGGLALWHSKTGLRESKRGTSGIQGAETSSGRADISSGLADTSSARRQGWSGPVGCCIGVGRYSILLYYCIVPGKVHFRPPPVSTSRQLAALEVEHMCARQRCTQTR